MWSAVEAAAAAAVVAAAELPLLSVLLRGGLGRKKAVIEGCPRAGLPRSVAVAVGPSNRTRRSKAANGSKELFPPPAVNSAAALTVTVCVCVFLFS